LPTHNSNDGTVYFGTDDEDDDDDESESDDDIDDDEGWITPGNIEAMKRSTVASTDTELNNLPVACVTTDYAMQVSGHCLTSLHVKCKSNYSVQNDESLPRHCTNERRVRKRDKKVRRDVI